MLPRPTTSSTATSSTARQAPQPAAVAPVIAPEPDIDPELDDCSTEEPAVIVEVPPPRFRRGLRPIEDIPRASPAAPGDRPTRRARLFGPTLGNAFGRAETAMFGPPAPVDTAFVRAGAVLDAAFVHPWDVLDVVNGTGTRNPELAQAVAVGTGTRNPELAQAIAESAARRNPALAVDVGTGTRNPALAVVAAADVPADEDLPPLVDADAADEPRLSCRICWQGMDDPLAREALLCGHTFHSHCILTWCNTKQCSKAMSCVYKCADAAPIDADAAEPPSIADVQAALDADVDVDTQPPAPSDDLN